ncbi:MAG: hypothetical protein IKN72_01970 [Clostridia bacterium]|nr:hypothetical protein [Clostridia bacterium]
MKQPMTDRRTKWQFRPKECWRDAQVSRLTFVESDGKCVFPCCALDFVIGSLYNETDKPFV